MSEEWGQQKRLPDLRTVALSISAYIGTVTAPLVTDILRQVVSQSSNLTIFALGLCFGIGLSIITGWIIESVIRPYREQDMSSDENRPPTAKIGFAPQEPVAGRPIMFDGARSFAPDRIVSYRWAVHGTTAMAPQFVHVFPMAGKYDVKLTVTDRHGATDTCSETIIVKESEGELVLDEVHPGASDDGGRALDREYVVFANAGERRLDLGGWTVRDGVAAEDRDAKGGHAFEFPDGFSLSPDATVTVHTGPEPEDGMPDGVEGSGEERHIFWGAERAVWDYRTDVVLVEDGGGHPVIAVQYERTGPGEYDFEDLDIETLQHWFPDVLDEQLPAAPEVNVSVDAGALARSVVSSTFSALLVPLVFGLLMGSLYIVILGSFGITPNLKFFPALGLLTLSLIFAYVYSKR